MGATLNVFNYVIIMLAILSFVATLYQSLAEMSRNIKKNEKERRQKTEEPFLPLSCFFLVMFKIFIRQTDCLAEQPVLTENLRL